MSTKARTVDSIGIDVSSRYARDQAQLDSKFLRESSISQNVEVSVLTPHIATEFEEYLAPLQQQAVANFAPPPNFLKSGARLFTHQLVPSLGSPETQDELLTKLEGLLEKAKSKKNLETIKTMVQLVINLDRDLSVINAQRNQYQRG